MGLNQPDQDDPVRYERIFRPRPPGYALAVGLLSAVLLYVVACVAGGSYGAAFFSIPFFFAFATAALYPARPYRLSFAVLGLALLVAILSFREGIICTLFALPVLAPMVAAGAFAGSKLTSRLASPRDRNGLVGFVLLVGAGWQVQAGVSDDPKRHPRHVATATRVIDAPPETVFAVLTEKELRVAPRWPWFVRIGLPMPERMLVERPGRDGLLRFDFAQGTAFARVTEWQAPRRLSYAVTHYAIHDLPFHITRLGRSPDYGFRQERVEDWLSLEDTRYELEPAPGNSTLLRRRVVWRRHLAPDFYFGWLEQTVMERGQVRLLELIQERVRARKPERRVEPTKTLALW
jgi:uncharacterized protein YndB with AHSA1/START domain